MNPLRRLFVVLTFAFVALLCSALVLGRYRDAEAELRSRALAQLDVSGKEIALALASQLSAVVDTASEPERVGEQGRVALVRSGTASLTLPADLSDERTATELLRSVAVVPAPGPTLVQPDGAAVYWVLTVAVADGAETATAEDPLAADDRRGIAVPLTAVLETAIAPALESGLEVELVAPTQGSVAQQLVWRSGDLPLTQAVEYRLPWPASSWTLRSAPRTRWVQPRAWMVPAGFGLLLSFAAAVAAWGFQRRPEILSAELAKRDQQAQLVNQRLIEEIQRRETSEERAQQEGLRDRTTELPNQAYFLLRIERALSRLRRRGEGQLAIAIVGLDRFGEVVDRLGVSTSDVVLHQVAARLESALADRAEIARLSGVRFGLLSTIEEPLDEQLLQNVLRDVFEHPFPVSGDEFFLTASAGIAQVEDAFEEGPAALRNAERAMQEAKASGGTRCVVFDPEMRERSATRLQMESDLRRALDRDELRLRLQPVVSLRDGRIAGFECLVRWQHPLDGLLPPSAFLPLAEETGLIVEVDRWIYRAASQLLESWLPELGREIGFYLAVNLSTKTVIEAPVEHEIPETLRQHSVPFSRLRLEVTESAVIGNVAEAREKLAALRGVGLTLMLDDFGTGYSSLSYLQQFRFDVLKIDRSFIQDFGVGRGNPLVPAIISMARDLEMSTVAEGIEHPVSIPLLRKLGCEYGQGYFFCKPVPPERAIEILRAQQPLFPTNDADRDAEQLLPD